MRRFGLLLAGLCACSSETSGPDAGAAPPPPPGELEGTAWQVCVWAPAGSGAPSCGNQLYDGERVCGAAVTGCSDRDLLRTSACFSDTDCALECLPSCAMRPPGVADAGME